MDGWWSSWEDIAVEPERDTKTMRKVVAGVEEHFGRGAWGGG